jgi:hypothetical protein
VIARVQSRREFLRSAGAFALSASLSLEYRQPELILYNGNIIIIETGSRGLKQSQSQATVSGGRDERQTAVANLRQNEKDKSRKPHCCSWIY